MSFEARSCLLATTLTVRVNVYLIEHKSSKKKYTEVNVRPHLNQWFNHSFGYIFLCAVFRTFQMKISLLSALPAIIYAPWLLNWRKNNEQPTTINFYFYLEHTETHTQKQTQRRKDKYIKCIQVIDCVTSMNESINHTPVESNLIKLNAKRRLRTKKFLMDAKEAEKSI